MNSKNTPRCICSAESPDGHTLFDSPAGQMTDQSSQLPHRVSRFRALENEKAMPTNDTCGPLFTRSSPSASFQSALENKLRQRMDASGSPEYELTWKEQDIGAGVPICALLARARHISGKGCSGAQSGWPSPAAETAGVSEETVAKGLDDQRKYGGQKVQMDLARSASLAGWPTPNAMEGGQTSRGGDRKDEPLMGGVVKLCGWPTPMAQNEEAGNCDYTRSVEAAMGLRASKNEPKAGWPTPAEDNANNSMGHKGTDYSDLPTTAQAAGWATPNCPRAHDSDNTAGSGKNRQMDIVKQILGGTPAGTPAATGKPAACQLNPRFSLWLMGYPDEWASCGARAMQSCRKSPRSSSEPQPKP